MGDPNDNKVLGMNIFGEDDEDFVPEDMEFDTEFVFEEVDADDFNTDEFLDDESEECSTAEEDFSVILDEEE